MNVVIHRHIPRKHTYIHAHLARHAPGQRLLHSTNEWHTHTYARAHTHTCLQTRTYVCYFAIFQAHTCLLPVTAQHVTGVHWTACVHMRIHKYKYTHNHNGCQMSALPATGPAQDPTQCSRLALHNVSLFMHFQPAARAHNHLRAR